MLPHVLRLGRGWGQLGMASGVRTLKACSVSVSTSSNKLGYLVSPPQQIRRGERSCYR